MKKLWLFCLVIAALVISWKTVAAEEAVEIKETKNTEITDVQDTVVAVEEIAQEAKAETEIANADTEEPSEDLLTKTLTQTYGAPVEVEINEQKCEIRFPAVEIKDVVIEQNEAKAGEDEKAELDETTVKEKIIGTLEATTAECSKVEDFGDMPQYKVEHRSANKILAQVYNHLNMPFVQNVSFKDFAEEMTVVPQIGLVSSYTMQLNDASYTETDATTGLKSEIGNLKNMQVKTNVSEENGMLKYLTDSQFNDFNLALPMMSMKIASEHQAAEAVYKVSDPTKFDYSNLLQNLTSLVSSRTRAVMKGMKINVDLVGMGISCDMELKSKADLKDDGNMDSDGTMVINHLQYSGDLIEKSKQPKEISINFALNDLDMNSIIKLSDMQMEALDKAAQEGNNEDFEIDQEALLETLNDLVDKAKLSETVEIKFDNANVLAEVNAHRENNYVHGNGKISINDLFNIFPELKDCDKNKTPQCAQTQLMLGSFDFLDLSKNNQTIIIKFDDKGVFINGKKVGEPIEMDLSKMMEEDANTDETTSTQGSDEAEKSESKAEIESGEDLLNAEDEPIDLGEPLDIEELMEE